MTQIDIEKLRAIAFAIIEGLHGKEAARHAFLEQNSAWVQALGAVPFISHAIGLPALPSQEVEPAVEQCKRCGHENPSWSAPSPLWNAVMRGDDINGEPIFDDMVCASCFIALCQEGGFASGFRLAPTVVHCALKTETPTGRIWDEKQWLWVYPPAQSGIEGAEEPRRTGEIVGEEGERRYPAQAESAEAFRQSIEPAAPVKRDLTSGDLAKVEALSKAFSLLDSFAGEGLGHVYGNGQTIDADDVVFELAAAFDIEPEPGWWRIIAGDVVEDASQSAYPTGAGEGRLGWDVDGMCDDHGVFACQKCALHAACQR